MIMTGMDLVHGTCGEEFVTVKTAFENNFTQGGELGASFAFSLNGKIMIDLWGGYRDTARTKPWEKNTLCLVHSVTKIATALCAHILVDREQLDIDAPVCRYWPKFAQAGKEKITVRQVMSHTSGVAGFDESLAPEDIYNWEYITGLLEKQAPWWEPGTQCGYHGFTFGHIIGELIKRVTGKTPGTFFREEVAEPLDIDFHIGLAAGEDDRTSDQIFSGMPRPGAPGYKSDDPDSISYRMHSNPYQPDDIFQTRAFRTAEIPAQNGYGNARSLAMMGALMACGGELDGIRLLSAETLYKATEEQFYGEDLVLRVPVRWGLGWGLGSKEIPMPSEHSFYWTGGKSIMVVDLDHRFCMAYVTNRVTTDAGQPYMGPFMALSNCFQQG
jgi:CubicO group peptidase (beta-lactamase class C family)